MMLHNFRPARSAVSSAAAFFLSAATLAPTAATQVPAGAVVVSGFRVPAGPFRGDSGLFVAHPRQPGALEPITGLPGSITFAGDPSTVPSGANAVLVDAATGNLVVGVSTLTTSVPRNDLHVLDLDGLHVVGVRRIPLGTQVADGGPGVFELDWIAADEVLVALGGIAGPAGAPAFVQVARVDLTTETVTPVDVGSFSSSQFINAICYDAGSDRIVFGIQDSATRSSEVRTASFAAPGTSTLLAAFPGSVRNLSIDPAGDVVAAVNGPGPSLVRIDATGAVTGVLSGLPSPNGVAIEPATGAFFVLSTAFPNDGLYYARPDGSSVTLLGNDQISGTGIGAVTGVDVRPNPVVYGAPSGRQRYTWSEEPDERRFPAAGGRLYATIDWPAARRPLFGSVKVALDDADFRLGRLKLLIDPFATVALVPLRLDRTARRSTLDVPLDGSAAGRTLYLQAFHAGFGGLSATAGLRVRVQ